MQINITFTGGQANKSHITKTDVGLGVGTLIAAGAAIVNRKKIASGAAKLGDSIINLVAPNRLKRVDTSKFKGVDLEARQRQHFLDEYIYYLKEPIKSHTGERLTPQNGYLVFGPDSKAKEQYFNWMISELGNAGVEIFDAGKGNKAKYKEVSDTWWNMWNNHSDEAFKKDGKFKAFVVRGLDEIGMHPKSKATFADSILKDSPDSNASCERHGIMLFYTCKDPGLLDPAVIRQGRIDDNYVPMPLADEPLEIWKEYLDYIKGYSPAKVTRAIEMAKDVLSKRGTDTMKEMEPHFSYTVPFQPPKLNDSLEKWEKYVDKTMENVSRDHALKELRTTLDNILGKARENDVYMEKFNEIRKMTDAVQTPEELPTWRKIVDRMISGIYDGGSLLK